MIEIEILVGKGGGFRIRALEGLGSHNHGSQALKRRSLLNVDLTVFEEPFAQEIGIPRQSRK